MNDIPQGVIFAAALPLNDLSLPEKLDPVDWLDNGGDPKTASFYSKADSLFTENDGTEMHGVTKDAVRHLLLGI